MHGIETRRRCRRNRRNRRTGAGAIVVAEHKLSRTFRGSQRRYILVVNKVTTRTIGTHPILLEVLALLRFPASVTNHGAQILDTMCELALGTITAKPGFAKRTAQLCFVERRDVRMMVMVIMMVVSIMRMSLASRTQGLLWLPRNIGTW